MHSEALNILVPRLVVKEQHVLIFQVGLLLELHEMSDLASWIDLQQVKVFDSLSLLPVPIRYLQQTQHLPGEVWRHCPRRRSNLYIAISEGAEDGRNLIVEGECFAKAVFRGVVGRRWF